jgi:hypothetical protein
MEIFLKGCKTSRSWSPVMMQDAPAVRASSRNLLSLGSRQALTIIFGKKTRELLSTRLIASKRSALFKKYLSNFLRKITSANSCKVGSEITNLPLSNARSRACALIDFRRRAALISELYQKQTYESSFRMSSSISCVSPRSAMSLRS